MQQQFAYGLWSIRVGEYCDQGCSFWSLCLGLIDSKGVTGYMAFRKYMPSSVTPSGNMKLVSFPTKMDEKAQPVDPQRRLTEADVDIDLKEVYFLIMHFLSTGPCHRTYGQFWNELLEHQLLPRRYHAWYSRSGAPSGDENDDGTSFPLSYNNLVERYSHIGKDHLVKLLKQLLLSAAAPSQGLPGGNFTNAAAARTLLGDGSFSLLASSQNSRKNEMIRPPRHMRWPHMLTDQVRGLRLREIGGGFTRHHRAPSIRAACYAIAKPSTMVQKMENVKRVRGHRAAVYCAIFDRSGRYVITGSDDRLVKIWSMETAYCLASCRGHEGDITDLAVSFNNTLVASASNDCIIRVWRLPDGLPISVLRGHAGAVTAIAFSPRPSSVYQLLSSSDDGTCRIWDARYSQFTPRIYVPKPLESVSGKSNGPSSSTSQQSHQIFCCAFNASGTFFVTGSSDTHARVWNACKSNSDDLERPNHELDVLSGHENDVNYVQFSGCAVASRFSGFEVSKEESLPKFRNSWFNHDNIVTCSRDGSAIIWTPRSRRSHGKAGRWTKAYHLKVPPPPMPPQPPRGGPRQRILPTPRGVNMIVWSLDNRFVLAAIMDCRICVWNAVDGSLVHSLTGHTESTYVLDVHPFNPRIAMSAGYDGKTIVWDIWEGKPIRTYENGRFKLVDGKFSPDGTSIILSDEVGQLYILSTGDGGSQKDAKYDQFFLGDYRPLVQDTNGNVLDQETQLAPYRRNMQDLLCDSGMIPYPEPYQSLYQKRRLGALGIEWRPSSVRFAVGADIQDYQMLPILDLDMLIDPLPGFLDAMDWEPEIEIRSDDTDSEYNVTEEYPSGGEQGSLSSNSSGDTECSGEDSEPEDARTDSLRRSRRKKKQPEVEIMTSSGRRVKRKNLDEYDGSLLGNNRNRKSRNGQKASRKKSSSSKSSRPRRAAARHALHLFSRITGTSTDAEEEYVSEGYSSESESLPDSDLVSEESDISMPDGQRDHAKGKQISLDKFEDVGKLPQCADSNLNAGKRRLVLRFPNRKCENRDSLPGPLPAAPLEAGEASETYLRNQEYNGGDSNTDEMQKSNTEQSAKIEHQPDLLEECKDGNIRWGGVKIRTTKRLKVGERLGLNACAGSSTHPEGHKSESFLSSNPISGKEGESACPSTKVPEQEDRLDKSIHLDNHHHHLSGNLEKMEGEENVKEQTEEYRDHEASSPPISKVVHLEANPSVPSTSGICRQISAEENASSIPTKLRICSKISRGCQSPAEVDINYFSDPRHSASDATNSNFPVSVGTGIQSLEEGDRDRMLKPESHVDSTSRSVLQDLQQVHSRDRMFTTVYRRSKYSRNRGNPEKNSETIEASASGAVNQTIAEGTGTRNEEVEPRPTSRDINAVYDRVKFRDVHEGSQDASRSSGKAAGNRDDSILEKGWRSNPMVAVGLRSARNRRASFYVRETSPPDRKRSNQSARSSWLMLSMHEEGSRYIPQRGDEVVYLRQGHQEYLGYSHFRDEGPWRTTKGNIKAVEFCKVEGIDYTTCPGSGESCCRMILKFVDNTSSVASKSFQLTLPEVIGFPDFLVERTRYDAAIERNWSPRDKCQVWWKNEGEEDGSWWEGRITAVKAKSQEFPDSPWERYVVQYKSDPAETHRHSPWELYDADTHWEQPHIDGDTRDKLLKELAKLESGNKAQDRYGIQKLKQVSQRSNFINRFPVPLSLEVIQSRVENNYYRSLEAVKHDVEVMLSNAESYFARNLDLSRKIGHLSEKFTRILSSL